MFFRRLFYISKKKNSCKSSTCWYMDEVQRCRWLSKYFLLSHDDWISLPKAHDYNKETTKYNFALRRARARFIYFFLLYSYTISRVYINIVIFSDNGFFLLLRKLAPFASYRENLASTTTIRKHNRKCAIQHNTNKYKIEWNWTHKKKKFWLEIKTKQTLVMLKIYIYNLQ